MFDHVSLKVRDFKKSLGFYRAALEPIGYEAQYVDEAGKSAGFGPKGEVTLWIAEGAPRSAVHLAFKGASRASVTKFHEAAVGAGGSDNGKPGARPDYSKTYWAAFVTDPDGNNVEVVTHSER